MDYEKDIEYIKLRYESRIAEYGEGIETLGWKDKESQRVRFEVLSGIGDLTGCSVLDVGCGFGDLYGFLSERFKGLTYLGVDISPRFVEIARKKHPDAKFSCTDIIKDRLAPGSYDYVLSSGIFNTRLSDNGEFFRRLAGEMFNVCGRGTAFNLLTNYVDYEREDLYYYDPASVFNTCRGWTRSIILRHDYPLYEFSVFMYRTIRPE